MTINLWSISSSVWGALTIVFIVSRSSKETSVQKWRHMSRVYKHHFLRFLLQKADTEMIKKKKRNRKTFCPFNTYVHSVSSLVPPFPPPPFFSSTVVVESIQNRHLKFFFHMMQVFYFSDYNRLLTTLRSDALIKLWNWDLSSSYHQLEVSFSAVNENHGTGWLFYTAKLAQ